MPLTCFATVGVSAPADGSFDFTGANTDNEIGTQTVAVPFSGRMSTLRAYFAGDGVSITARCCAWRSSDGAVIGKTNKFSAPSGTHAIGGQTLNVGLQDGASLVLESGQTPLFGFWRDPAASQVWSVAAAGTFVFQTDLSGDVGSMAGNAVCGGGFICGNPQAYADMVGGDAKAISRAWPAYLSGRRRR